MPGLVVSKELKLTPQQVRGDKVITKGMSFMTNKNEQEKKKSYVAPAMDVIEFDCGSLILLEGSLKIIVDD